MNRAEKFNLSEPTTEYARRREHVGKRKELCVKVTNETECSGARQRGDVGKGSESDDK